MCPEGKRIAIALRELGSEPLEVYPFATLRLLGLPWPAKMTPAGRRRIHRVLRPMVPGIHLLHGRIRSSMRRTNGGTAPGTTTPPGP